VATYAGVQTIPDKQVAAVGAKCNSFLRVTYFGVALQCLAGTELVLTLTSGMTSAVKADRKLRLVKAPQELRPFHFLMAWHPRIRDSTPILVMCGFARQCDQQLLVMGKRKGRTASLSS
jgi:hypothetical protein